MSAALRLPAEPVLNHSLARRVVMVRDVMADLAPDERRQVLVALVRLEAGPDAGSVLERLFEVRP